MTRILLVDDDAEIRLSLRKLLEKAGFEAIAVASGRAALDRLRGEEFEVLITDLLMDDLDGIELIRQIRSTRSGLAIIAISGGGLAQRPEANLRVAIKMGADATFTKPVPGAALLSTIRSLIGASS